MKRALIVCSALFLLAAMSSARTLDRQAAQDAVVASEHAFAKLAAEKGVRRIRCRRSRRRPRKSRREAGR